MSEIKKKDIPANGRMVCETCKTEGKKSKLSSAGIKVTNLDVQDYFDEEGLAHWHDPNKRTTTYVCSRGHETQAIFYTKCPSCDYGK